MLTSKNVTTIDVAFESDVWLAAYANSILVSTIEFLLFQRNQIPFVFQTFKYMTTRWPNHEHENFFVEKQRRLALSTLNEIVELTKHIEQESKRNTITTARLIFGATPLTPKEIYIIKMPQVSNQHSSENHSWLDNMTRNVILSLLTSEDLCKVFSNNLGITNMYLDIETIGNDYEQNSCDNFDAKEDDANFPTKCPIVCINLIHKPPKNDGEMNCCRDIIVFESISELNLNGGVENEAKMEDVDENLAAANSWKEAKVFVKGFKDIFVKGRSIW